MLPHLPSTQEPLALPGFVWTVVLFFPLGLNTPEMFLMPQKAAAAAGGGKAWKVTPYQKQVDYSK